MRWLWRQNEVEGPLSHVVGQDGGGLIFDRGTLQGVIFLAQLAGLVLKIEVAQVLIGRVFTLSQIQQARLDFTRVDLTRLVKDVDK
jgi:hypothetical protein